MGANGLGGVAGLPLLLCYDFKDYARLLFGLFPYASTFVPCGWRHHILPDLTLVMRSQNGGEKREQVILLEKHEPSTKTIPK